MTIPQEEASRVRLQIKGPDDPDAINQFLVILIEPTRSNISSISLGGLLASKVDGYYGFVWEIDLEGVEIQELDWIVEVEFHGEIPSSDVDLISFSNSVREHWSTKSNLRESFCLKTKDRIKRRITWINEEGEDRESRRFMLTFDILTHPSTTSFRNYCNDIDSDEVRRLLEPFNGVKVNPSDVIESQPLIRKTVLKRVEDFRVGRAFVYDEHPWNDEFSMESLMRASRIVFEIWKAGFKNGQGQLNWERLASCFAKFSVGDLRLSKLRSRKLSLNMEPDSALFFGFGELAFASIRKNWYPTDNEFHMFWSRFAALAIAGTYAFIELAAPARGRRKWRAYEIQFRNSIRGNQLSHSFVIELANLYRNLYDSIESLETRFAELASWALIDE